MAKRLTFEEFRTALDQRTMPVDKLPEYVQFDPDSPIPRLAFRADALVDRPPATYDVDAEVYRMLRVVDDERDARLEAFSFVGRKRVVAEGDSWFNLPQLLRPPAIANWIQRNGRFRMKNIAYWGHTLERVVREKEYVSVIASDRPDHFMFSAGGNDLQLGLAAGAYVHAYDPERPVDKYLTDSGQAALAQIGRSYRDLFSELFQRFPSLRRLAQIT